MKLIYVICVGVVGFVGVMYDRLSHGLAAQVNGGTFYCNELLSGGGEDSAMIFLFSAFLLPFTVRLMRWRHALGWVELTLYWAAFGLALLGVVLAQLDCAQVLYTAFGVPDLPLAAALLCWVGSAISLGRWRGKSDAGGGA